MNYPKGCNTASFVNEQAVEKGEPGLEPLPIMPHLLDAIEKTLHITKDLSFMISGRLSNILEFNVACESNPPEPYMDGESVTARMQRISVDLQKHLAMLESIYRHACKMV